MPDLATAQALSQAAYNVIACSPKPQCDPVTNSAYQIIGLTNGKYAIVVHLGDFFQGETIGPLPNGKTFTLTASQIASLQTRAQMNTLLPDILTGAIISSRLTVGQLTAITNYANTHPAFKTQYTALLAGPIDLEGPAVATLQSVLGQLQAAGILSAADVANASAAQAAAAVPN